MSDDRPNAELWMLIAVGILNISSRDEKDAAFAALDELRIRLDEAEATQEEGQP